MKDGLRNIVASALLGAATMIPGAATAQSFSNNAFTDQTPVSPTGEQVASPVFRDAKGDDNTLGTVDDDYRPHPTSQTTFESPAITTTSLYGDTDSFIGAYHPNDNPLPVEIANTYAQIDGDAARIGFTALDERNLAEYRVTQATPSGDDLLTTIQADNADRREYTVRDNNLRDNAVTTTDSTQSGYGELTYQITPVNLDGSTEPTRTITVEKRLDPFTATTPHPNPARNEVRYSLEANDETSVTTSVYDVLGRQVHRTTQNINPGKTRETLNVNDLSSGTYFLRHQTRDGETDTDKFTVIQ
jgi:hypothetical protein